MNYFIGAEINGNQLKISAFKKDGHTFDLLKLDSINLNTDPNEASKQLVIWIDKNLPQANSISAVLTISESALYIKELEFPKIPIEKFSEAVYWEIPSVAPIPQSDAVFDWQILSESKEMLKVLVIVGKSSHVQNMLSIFRGAQIDVVAVEPSSYAFSRIANAQFDTNLLLCLVQEYGMDFVILKNGVPFFATSSTGHTQAEKISHIKSGTDLNDYIISEGKKIISYWEGKGNMKIHQVIVAGDLVYKYFGLSATLNLFPPIPTIVATFKKTKNIKTNAFNDIDLASYLISSGAGLRFQQKDVSEGINLIPPTEKQKTEKVRSQRKIISHLTSFIIVNAIILVGLSVSIITLNFWWLSLEKEQNKLSLQLSNRSTNNVIGEVNEINSTIKNVIQLTKNQDDLGAKLKNILSMTPQSINLTSINMLNTKSREWTIEGIGDRESILVYYKKISQDSGAKEVNMPYTNFNKETDNEFSITLIW